MLSFLAQRILRKGFLPAKTVANNYCSLYIYSSRNNSKMGWWFIRDEGQMNPKLCKRVFIGKVSTELQFHSSMNFFHSIIFCTFIHVPASFSHPGQSNMVPSLVIWKINKFINTFNFWRVPSPVERQSVDRPLLSEPKGHIWRIFVKFVNIK